MEIRYESYDHVILDASSLKYDIPAELWEYQRDHSLLAAQTFESECNGYEILLPDGKRALFTENKQRFATSVCADLLFREEQYVRKGLNQDVVGLLQLLCGKSTRPAQQQRSCLLVTGDLSQLESIWIYGVPTDVMFLQNGKLYNHQNVQELEALFRYKKIPEVSAGTFKHGDQCIAYRDGGIAINLSSIHKTRESACIYQTPDHSYAKIFTKYRLTEKKMKHVERLIECGRELGLDWALFPTELIYQDQDCQVPVGYLMPKAGNTVDVTRCKLRTNVKSTSGVSWEQYGRDTCYYEYLYLALMITRQTAYLKSYNIWPSDYNLANFALFCPSDMLGEWPSGFPKLYMWDTDSFCWEGYVSDRWHRDLEPPNNYGCSVGEQCANALYQMVFNILTLGGCPYGVNREDPPAFLFDKYKKESRGRFFYIPANLRRLFHDVFACGYPPSVPCLLQALEQACEEMSVITLEELDQWAQRKAEEGAGFRPVPERTKLALPACPKAPDVSAPLYVWSRPTVPFSVKHSRHRAQEQTESSMGSK